LERDVARPGFSEVVDGWVDVALVPEYPRDLELEARKEETTSEVCVLNINGVWELVDILPRRFELVLTEVTSVDTTVEVTLIVVVSSRDEEKLLKVPIKIMLAENYCGYMSERTCSSERTRWQG
jgi:hypothetical protein